MKGFAYQPQNPKCLVIESLTSDRYVTLSAMALKCYLPDGEGRLTSFHKLFARKNGS